MSIILVASLLFVITLLVVFVVHPILSKGLAMYLYHIQSINPFLYKVVNKVNYIKFYKLGRRWRDRTELIDESSIPVICWNEDENNPKGYNSFMLLDSYAEDVRPLLLPLWNLTCDKSLWFLSHFTNEYPYAKETTQIIEHNVNKCDNSISFQTGSKLDTWIYLPAKEKQPIIYALDFDFITYTSMQETLQVCFAVKSLAQRFRFVVRKNKTMHFEIIDKGFFLSQFFADISKPFSFVLGERYHISIQVIGDVFAFYINNNLEMAVKVKDYVPQENYWNIIFWNGVIKEQNMNVEISNFKILHNKQ